MKKKIKKEVKSFFIKKVLFYILHTIHKHLQMLSKEQQRIDIKFLLMQKIKLYRIYKN